MDLKSRDSPVGGKISHPKQLKGKTMSTLLTSSLVEACAAAEAQPARRPSFCLLTQLSQPTRCVLAMARSSLFGFCSTLALLLLVLLYHAPSASTCFVYEFGRDLKEFGKRVQVRRTYVDSAVDAVMQDVIRGALGSPSLHRLSLFGAAA